MSFGIANNVKSKVRVCTPELLMDAINMPKVSKICAEIVDAYEAYLRGEIAHEEFETRKNDLKKQLPIITPHATFKKGRRKNDEAIPSGLSIYDVDHIENPAGRWMEIECRKEELGIVMAHITPSTKGIRLIFIIPKGMSLAEAQAWMARQLGDAQYDSCVKDYARCSYLVPREYILYQSEALFEVSPQITQSPTESVHLVIKSEAKNLDDTKVGAPEIFRRDAPLDDKTEGTYPQTYEDIPYTEIVETLT